MKEIILSQNKVALVDDADFEWLNQWKWCAHKKETGIFYAIRGHGGRKDHKIIKMHRVILGITDPKIAVDHINRDGLYNCRSNLRVANHSQNGANTIARNYGSSKYLGVSWLKKRRKWLVQIQKGNEQKFIGEFSNEIDAALAYNKVAIERHGEFARLNII